LRQTEVVPQDYKIAVKWFTRAAEQGDAAAQSNLGPTQIH
jgi:TPR repeat protein